MPDEDDDHPTWESLVAELTDKVASELAVITWRVQHPWQYRRIRFRMWLRRVVWKLTRIDIG